MTSSIAHTCNAVRILLLAFAAATLAGCATGSGGAGAPAAEAAKPPEPPMTHQRAARECWMATENGRADLPLDQRADLVTKCIERKMKAAKA